MSVARPLLAVPLLSLALAGCGGGAVHFVSGLDQAPPPPPPDPPPTTVIDHFVYGQPSGDAIVIFDFYPRESMIPERNGFSALAENFTAAYWAGASGYGETRFGVGRDLAYFRPAWFPYNSASPNTPTPQSDSLIFLQTQLDVNHMPSDYNGEGEPVTPVDGLLQMGETIVAPLEPAKRPVWIHFVDLRNLDFYPSSQEQNIAVTMPSQLAQALTRDSLSPYRFQLYPFTYRGACGSPASNFLSFLSAYPTHSFDLCRLKNGDGTVFEELASAIHANQQRLVLSRPPHLDTLVFKAAGKSIPREQLIFKPGTNELSLTVNAVRGLHAGDEIEVTYETN